MIETKQEVVAALTLHDLPQAEQAALIDRIVASAHFRRAARLREFLLFVGQRTMRNGAVPIHEQEIGAAVFERPEVYDTSVDNIVRVNATELRKRLELYFSTDGADEPIVVEMPRGSYTLQFRKREMLAETAEAAAATSLAADALVERPQHDEAKNVDVVPPRARAGKLWPAIALLLLLVVAGLLWQNMRLQRELSPWHSGTALRALWSEFLESGQEVDIVLADTSFALAQDIENRSIPLTSYLNYDYKRVDNVPGLSADKRDDIGSVLDRNNGSVGDYIVAQRILALDPHSPALRLKFAREYSAEAIKTNSVILIGSRQSNPWVELFDSRVNFSMDYDPVLHRSSVRNRQPKPGEQPVYVGSGDLSRNEGLSIIAFMPDLSRSGSALMIEGTDSQATRAAGEFVTSDATLGAFLDRIGSHNFPYFEILLGNSQLTGTPLHSQILAYRIYPRTGNTIAAEAGSASGSQEKER